MGKVVVKREDEIPLSPGLSKIVSTHQDRQPFVFFLGKP